jgi:hypothetical protein
MYAYAVLLLINQWSFMIQMVGMSICTIQSFMFYHESRYYHEADKFHSHALDLDTLLISFFQLSFSLFSLHPSSFQSIRNDAQRVQLLPSPCLPGPRSPDIRISHRTLLPQSPLPAPQARRLHLWRHPRPKLHRS